MWYGLTLGRMIQPFFFTEPTVTSHSYQDVWESFVLSHIRDDKESQQDGTSPHYTAMICECCNANSPRREIGRGGWNPLPPCFQDLTPLASYLWAM